MNLWHGKEMTVNVRKTFWHLWPTILCSSLQLWGIQQAADLPQGFNYKLVGQNWKDLKWVSNFQINVWGVPTYHHFFFFLMTLSVLWCVVGVINLGKLPAFVILQDANKPAGGGRKHWNCCSRALPALVSWFSNWELWKAPNDHNPFCGSLPVRDHFWRDECNMQHSLRSLSNKKMKSD